MSGDQIERGAVLGETTIPGLSAAEIADYSSVSGDDNPVHTDRQLANDLGLEDVPVQGMLLMALANSYIENWQYCETLRKLSMRFVHPALANRSLRIAGKVMVSNREEQTAIVRVMLFQEDKLVAMGDANITLASA
ncbi:MaoC family dehydratase [Roseibium sp. Sym1]|uniref:MaoC family dehydratase n=1 Tax=Roseibium sp. Sym1 TaxID=3016006 RepID=UPI0022B3B7D8|nr:MaoC family dehydratase [Roseibium sp. Sym1]